MPKSCAAWGCPSHNCRAEKLKWFRFPDKVTFRERWEKWVKAVDRKQEDGSIWKPTSKWTYLCEKHFISGASNKDPKHPDYVPSIFPHKNCSEETNEQRMRRYLKAKKRSDKLKEENAVRSKDQFAVVSLPVFLSRLERDPSVQNLLHEREVPLSAVKEEVDTSHSETVVKVEIAEDGSQGPSFDNTCNIYDNINCFSMHCSESTSKSDTKLHETVVKVEPGEEDFDYGVGSQRPSYDSIYSNTDNIYVTSSHCSMPYSGNTFNTNTNSPEMEVKVEVTEEGCYCIIPYSGNTFGTNTNSSETEVKVEVTEEDNYYVGCQEQTLDNAQNGSDNSNEHCLPYNGTSLENDTECPEPVVKVEVDEVFDYYVESQDHTFSNS
ncbi:uncharacterized protein LOC123542499 [Mercenaria mercenaria]|uniref:uncharacterized protein LOC123542499 n=1 Tax=Mercenaria mercenaria TaxID=6596 RepID=UPI00234F4358|nr:uncharacterized protein LOC123542499 [Mercenaria mercenaria]